MFYDDTIAAIVTASVNGGVSIIRISGSHAIESADKILQLNNKILAECKSHTVNYGFVVNEKSETIDEVIVLLMRAPNSYTKEDVVEIQCHGGIFLCQEILHLVLSQGVRIAEPGEFTKRAFLNGRIDLSQAEAVMDLIGSKSRYAVENSISQLKGTVKEKIICIRNDILNDVAYIEAALDDPEHISLDGFSEDFKIKIVTSLKELQEIRDNYDNGRMIQQGIQTVIIGRPNVGKSSFLNSMLGIDRAIVTDVPGTTRDTLEEDVRLGDLFLHLIDTAGIHNTEDKVEKIGIRKAKENITLADFCILVIDGSEKITDDDIFLMKEIKDRNAVILLNKNDLDLVIDESEIKKYTDKQVLSFSAKTGDGLKQLERYIKRQFYLEKISFNDQIYISNERQRQAVEESIHSLEHVMDSMQMDMGEDFYTIDLMDAYGSLGKIIGESVDDDLIDTIFRKFCMGK